MFFTQFLDSWDLNTLTYSSYIHLLWYPGFLITLTYTSCGIFTFLLLLRLLICSQNYFRSCVLASSRPNTWFRCHFLFNHLTILSNLCCKSVKWSLVASHVLFYFLRLRNWFLALWVSLGSKLRSSHQIYIYIYICLLCW